MAIVNDPVHGLDQAKLINQAIAVVDEIVVGDGRTLLIRDWLAHVRMDEVVEVHIKAFVRVDGAIAIRTEAMEAKQYSSTLAANDAR